MRFYSLIFENNKILALLRKKIEKNRILSKIIFNLFELFLKFRFKLYESKSELSQIYKVYFFNPLKVKYQSFNQRIIDSNGAVIGGDWDLKENLKKFKQSEKYISFYEHFILKKRWEETKYYKSVEKAIKRGNEKYRCVTLNDLKERFDYFDYLYNRIKNYGYKTQENLVRENGKVTDTGGYKRIRRKDHEIKVAIGREGEIIFLDGRHRLMIAQLLNLKKVPFIIGAIHQDFLEKN